MFDFGVIRKDLTSFSRWTQQEIWY